MMLPVNVAEITQSVVDMLTADSRLDGVIVERAEEVNKDPTLKGWVGVYRTRVRYTTTTLGAGVARLQAVSLVVLVQQNDPRSGKDCEDALEALVRNVLSVLLTDESLGGKVDILDPTEFEIRYEDYTKVDNIFSQMAAIHLTGLVRPAVQ